MQTQEKHCNTSGCDYSTYLCSDVLVAVLKERRKGFHQKLKVHDLGSKLSEIGEGGGGGGGRERE